MYDIYMIPNSNQQVILYTSSSFHSFFPINTSKYIVVYLVLNLSIHIEHNILYYKYTYNAPHS